MGMMFGGWAREEEENAQWYIDKYGKELGPLIRRSDEREAERNALLWDIRNPLRWSKTEPKVCKKDVIAFWNEKTKTAEKESYIQDVLEDGSIKCRYLDGRNDGKSFIWEGPYSKICSVSGEY